MNNYEKIKNMSIDEMAKWLSKNICNYCIYQKQDCEDFKCYDGIKQWLESEEGAKE